MQRYIVATQQRVTSTGGCVSLTNPRSWSYVSTGRRITNRKRNEYEARSRAREGPEREGERKPGREMGARWTEREHRDIIIYKQEDAFGQASSPAAAAAAVSVEFSLQVALTSCARGRHGARRSRTIDGSSIRDPLSSAPRTEWHARCKFVRSGQLRSSSSARGPQEA